MVAYQIFKCVGKFAYEIELSSEWAPVLRVFHASMLKKCIGDLVSIIPLEDLQVDECLSYEQILVEISDK